MTATIPLIDTLDGFELVRDKVALIIASESAAQQALATTAGKDSDLWKLRVYLERSNPWEVFREGVTDFSPVINVWYDNSNTNLGSSNLGTRQNMTSIINIDCIGYAETNAVSGGQEPGDEYAALTAHRAARLVRGILMHGKYRYLGLANGIVGRRHILTRTAFQPQSGSQGMQRIMGVRLALSVDHNEFIGIEEYETIANALITIKHDPTGAIIAQLDIDTTVEE